MANKNPTFTDIVSILQHPLDCCSKTRKVNLKWSLQGFGMLRLYISENERLHVWDNRYKIAHVTELHTHPWDFESVIFSGRIENSIYGRVSTPNIFNYGDKLPLYHQQTIICGPGGCATGETQDVYLRVTSHECYYKGQRYSQKAHEIHKTNYVNGTVSLVTRTFLEDTEHALVFFLDGDTWVSAEPREATDDEVMAITSLALDNMREEYRAALGTSAKF